MVTDTGNTVTMIRDGIAAQIPVLIRDGHYCLCGDLHGRFARCVGSARPLDGRPGESPRRRERVSTTRGRDAQLYFPMPTRRLPAAINQAVIDSCDGCGPFAEAFYYCEAHRSEAIRKVLLASRKSDGVISLHLMLAERGYDIVS